MKRNYTHIFFDLDHTLWDFEANARNTLEELFVTLKLEERGVNDFEQFYQNYLVHNDKLWERYRKGYIKQDELRVKRMRLSLLDFKIADEALAQAMNVQFLELLPTRKIVFPHTMEILDYLREKNTNYISLQMVLKKCSITNSGIPDSRTILNTSSLQKAPTA
ncbi:MAG: hypothetical protein NVV59_03665 [Chitinophagaceae bacterium]|nr:hypothetical protein [Chitinophagaceae bacterium]